MEFIAELEVGQKFWLVTRLDLEVFEPMTQPYLAKIADLVTGYQFLTVRVVVCRFRRQTHVTPKSFLSFLEGYKTLYSDKVKNLNELAGRMTTGLLKLDEASESVDELSKELVVKEKDLVVANQKADKVRMIISLPTWYDDDDYNAVKG